MSTVLTASGYVLTAPGRLEFTALDPAPPGPGEARVRVAGCGVCHTDVTFFTGAVRTKRSPVVLGHEIAGVVEDAPPPFDHLVGRQVIVPAVLPCGTCELCRAGRDTACTSQIFPGCDIDGGFATHVIVPAQHLLPLPDDLGALRLEELAVIADAVTTPYQALHKSGATAGDLVVVIGVGGIGTYAVQIARALGCRVAAIDVAAASLERAQSLGVTWTFNVREQDGKAIRKQLLAEAGVATHRWRIFEMSGTRAGQELAWALLQPACTLGVIGYTVDKPEIRLSNLMALDATAFGSWGCSPRHYGAVVDLVLSGQVAVKPFIEAMPMSVAPELLAALGSGEHRDRRPVLIP